MLEELHWSHTECITFPSDQSVLFAGAAPLLIYIYYFLPEIGCLRVNKDKISSNNTSVQFTYVDTT